MTEPEADAALQKFLQRENLSPCKCGRHIDRGDVAWSNGETEAGTPYSYVEIHCLSCHEEIASFSTWMEIESFEDLVESALDDYEPNGRKRA